VSLRFITVDVEGEEAVELREHITRLLSERYRVLVYPSFEALMSDYPPVNVAALLGAPTDRGE